MPILEEGQAGPKLAGDGESEKDRWRKDGRIVPLEGINVNAMGGLMEPRPVTLVKIPPKASFLIGLWSNEGRFPIPFHRGGAPCPPTSLET
jgi:hypothetical protein